MQRGVVSMSITLLIRSGLDKPLTQDQINTIEEVAGVRQALNVESEVVDAYDPNHLQNSYALRLRGVHDACMRLIDVNLQRTSASKTKPQFATWQDELEGFDIDRPDFEALEEFLQTNYQKYLQLISAETDLEPIHLHFQNFLKDLVVEIARIRKISEEKAYKLLGIADEYVSLTAGKPILVTVTKMPGGGDELYVQMDIPQQPFSDSQIDEILRARPKSNDKPSWYLEMRDEEKKIFDHMMLEVNTREDVLRVMPAISSKHRTIPGVANFLKHKTFVMTDDGVVVSLQPTRYRSSMISSRDLLKLKDTKKVRALRKAIAFANAQQIIQDAIDDILQDPLQRQKFIDPVTHEISITALAKLPILMQTLISPIGTVTLAQLINHPDKALYEDKLAAIQQMRKSGVEIRIPPNGEMVNIRFSNILSTNHPLNKARHITGSDGKVDTLKIIELGREYLARTLRDRLTGHADAIKLTEPIRSATDALEDLIQTSPSTFLDNQLQLHKAALEEFIVSRIGGISYGSCVSGKDRKGLETIYVDALEIFYSKNGRVPGFNVPGDRVKFANIFAELFVSRHQHKSAGLNALGSDGIKSVKMYLPTDIIKAINALDPKILSESRLMANNNELAKVKQLVPSQVKQSSRGSSMEMSVAARQSGYNEISRAIGMIIDLVNSNHWKSKSGKFVTPDGIDQFRTALKKLQIKSSRNLLEGSKDEREYLLEMIFKSFADIVGESFSKKSLLRESMTQTFYDLVGNLVRDKTTVMPGGDYQKLETLHYQVIDRPVEVLIHLHNYLQSDLWKNNKCPDGLARVKAQLANYMQDGSVQTDPIKVLAKLADISIAFTNVGGNFFSTSAMDDVNNNLAYRLHKSIKTAAEKPYDPDVMQGLLAEVRVEAPMTLPRSLPSSH